MIIDVRGCTEKGEDRAGRAGGICESEGKGDMVENVGREGGEGTGLWKGHGEGRRERKGTWLDKISVVGFPTQRRASLSPDVTSHHVGVTALLRKRSCDHA